MGVVPLKLNKMKWNENNINNDKKFIDVFWYW
jgi:hypothetical protein